MLFFFSQSFNTDKNIIDEKSYFKNYITVEEWNFSNIPSLFGTKSRIQKLLKKIV